MGYPAHMTDEELVTYGFAICRDDPNKAYSTIYPTLSFRHRCSACGIWSETRNGLCLRCHQGKKPFKVNNQSFKLYLCCDDDDCPIRQKAFSILLETGINPKWPSHDGYGGYLNLELLKSMSEEERIQFYEKINNISVSKFRARKLCHPGSKMRSKLPKTK